jgi:hypothetical protein
MATQQAQSERVTFLATPALKARLVELAHADGLSIGEYVRRRIQDEGEGEDALTKAQEAELGALIDQVNAAVPRMNAAFDDMSETIRVTRSRLDATLREAGIRK